MQEVLVDRGQLQLQRLVQVLDDFGIALHGFGSGAGNRLGYNVASILFRPSD
jgi:hypothetical protein